MEAYQCGNDIRLSPSAAEVLDEGEGLGNLGHNGVEEPVVVGADVSHGLIRKDLFNLSEICSLGHFSKLGGAPLGGCDGVEVAALSRRRPPRHVGMRWCRGSRSVPASSTHACSLDLRFVALVGVAAVGTCWCSRERWR